MASSASDQTVTARDVLRAVSEVRRRGSRAALEEFEKREPDLAEFLLEELSAVHHATLASGAEPRKVRRLTRRIEELTVVLVTALRQAHRRLWDLGDEDGDGNQAVPPTSAPPSAEPPKGDIPEGGPADGPDARR